MAKTTVEILRPPGAANLAEFGGLAKEKDITLKFIGAGDRIGRPDILILPGTRNVIEDLVYLKKSGYADQVRAAAKNKSAIIGISGGFEMLGTKIIDIRGSECRFSKSDGLSFFNIVTRLMPSAVYSHIEFNLYGDGVYPRRAFRGFESHCGRTKYLAGSKPLFMITKRDKRDVEIPDGAISDGSNIIGTYIHGIFGDEGLKKYILKFIRERR